MLKRIPTFVFSVCCFALGVIGTAHASTNESNDPIYEQRVVEALTQIQNANLSEALTGVKSLIDDYPTSRLGHMLYGDLLMAYANPINEIGGPLKSDNDSLAKEFVDEMSRRWNHNQESVPAHQGQLPATLVKPAPSHQYLIYVDLDLSRLYVYENIGDVPKLVKDYYVTMGLKGTRKLKQGDQRTPIGVYYVTNFLPGEALPDRYGPGAFPINYPNELDKRLSRTGYGIWLHGSPSNRYARPPKASDGCVTLSNDDFNDLFNYIEPDGLTPVIIADESNWLPQNKLIEKRDIYASAVEQWRTDWESLDNDRYLKHYSRDRFSNGSKDFNAWSEYKRQVNEGKSFVEINLRDVSIFEYPGEPEMFVVNFDQEYRSNNYYGVSRKKQYWSKNQDTNQWEIIYEGRG